MALNFDTRPKPQYVRYMKITIGLLALSVVAVVTFTITLGVSAYNLVQTSKPVVRSLTQGNLNHAISEAHDVMLKARHATENLPLADVLKNTNILLKHSNVLIDEVSKWRHLSRHVMLMVRQHPEWPREVHESLKLLQMTTRPLATESKEWRNTLRGATGKLKRIFSA